MEDIIYILYDLIQKFIENRKRIPRNKNILNEIACESPFPNETSSLIWTSTPKAPGSQINIISKLRTEVNQLRTMLIDHINYCNEIHFNKRTSMYIDKSIQTNISAILDYIPLPPPPPPPLPPTLPFYDNSILVIKQRKPVHENNRSNQIQLSLKEILKDVANVKLKPIPRTPGGQPAKFTTPSLRNNSFTEILKKRFNAFNESFDN